MKYLLMIFLLVITLVSHVSSEEYSSHCRSYASPVFLNFDEISITTGGATTLLPIPYQGFSLKRQNTRLKTYQNSRLPVMNTSRAIEIYHGSASSEPNAIYTAGENLFLTKEGGGVFGIRSFQIATVFMDEVEVNVDSFLRETPRSHKTLVLHSGQRVVVSMDWDQIDTIVIGCRHSTKDSCSHLLFDDFVLCPT